MPAEPLVAARGLSVGYGGEAVLSGVDLAVRAGEIVALLGPNGSGKSTLLRALAGDLRTRAGTIERPAAIGYAADEPVHVDPLSVRANAAWFARACGGDAALGALPALLTAFGLDPWADRPAGELSFGGRRKLLLVQALAHAPALLLLDEPTVGLDPDAVAALRAALDGVRGRGGAVVIAANDLDLAAGVATRVVFLRAGAIVADAPPAELLRAMRGSVRIEIDLAVPPSGLTFGAGIAATPVDAGYVLEAPSTAALPDICRSIEVAGARLHAIRVHETDLTDAWRAITGDVWRLDGADR